MTAKYRVTGGSEGYHVRDANNNIISSHHTNARAWREADRLNNEASSATAERHSWSFESQAKNNEGSLR